MNRKALFSLLLTAAFVVPAFADDPLTTNVVSNITAAQRWPWNGKVDINYTLTSEDANPIFRVAFFGQVGSGEPFALNTLEGEGSCGVTFASGVKRVTWDASIDAPNIESNNVKFGIIALDVTDAADYLVLDLNNFTMSYNMAGPDLEHDTQKACKTLKIWFKRIKAGTFYMGSATDEPGRQPTGYYEDKHEVTITKPFYIGVFECTEAQYAAITDSTSSSKFPKVQIKYEDMRGSKYGVTWPTYTDRRVDANSFFGKMRQKTGYGLKFDLPTEAQWEMAARDKGDGTYHDDYVWNDGTTFWKTNIDETDPENPIITKYVDYSDLTNLAWFADQTGDKGTVHEVGLKRPGINGLYDIHGNAWEQCIDRMLSHLNTSPVTDPVGGSTAKNLAVVKGGSIYKTDPPNYCRMAMRQQKNAKNNNVGFRIAIVF